MSLVRREWIVSGRVQGVYYRAWTKDKALHLALTGWVKNLSDGTVKVVAEGDPQVLDLFKKDLEEGPPAAVVKEVSLISETPIKEREYREFEIKY
ncbi:MAG: acylphosphatase [Candidatus Dadabacteria bacterium]|nr:MAG: acylphosphatase [Candidatus Dadabacteria bacterium]